MRATQRVAAALAREHVAPQLLGRVGEDVVGQRGLRDPVALARSPPRADPRPSRRSPANTARALGRARELVDLAHRAREADPAEHEQPGGVGVAGTRRGTRSSSAARGRRRTRARRRSTASSSCGAASATVSSEGRLSTTPIAPSALCTPISTTRALEVGIVQRRRGEQQLAGQRFVHAALRLAPSWPASVRGWRTGGRGGRRRRRAAMARGAHARCDAAIARRTRQGRTTDRE